MDYTSFHHSSVFSGAFLTLMFLFSVFTFAQSSSQLKRIKASYSIAKIDQLKMSLEHDFSEQQQSIQELAKLKGWILSERKLDGTLVELQEIGSDGTPLYYTTFSDKLSKISRADALYTSGSLHLDVNGEGMQVGLWDGGTALRSHQEFNDRVQLGDSSSEIDAHATLVAGTMVASGIKNRAQGVAYKATAVTSDWTRDKIEVTEAASNGLLLSNHSYGIRTDRVPDWYFGSYIRVSQDWDKIMYNAPYYLMVTAAGNAQKLNDNSEPISGSTADGFDLMLGFTTAKNGITVAAVDTKLDNKGNLKNASVTSYSSFGPIDDGRIKPDISGGGTVYTAHSSGTKNYNSATGTSLAAPGITASMLLLQQYYEQLHGNYMKAASLKGLVLQSADDVDAPGPDYKMGWGVMNAKRAAEVIKNQGFRSEIIETTLAEDEIYTLTVQANGEADLVAAVSWTDPASEFINRGNLNDPTPALVNDLDIRITKDNTTYYPWKLNPLKAKDAAIMGDNTVDPFEKIAIEGASGIYTISIRHKGVLKNKIQDFSLIVSGIAVTACLPETPNTVILKEAGVSTVELGWEGTADTLFEVAYRGEDEETWATVFTDENSIILEGLEENVNYIYKLRSFCTAEIGSDFSEEKQFLFRGSETELLIAEEYETLQVNEDIQFSVYPNPAIDKIVVETPLSAMTQYRIMDTTGNTIKTAGMSSTAIDVSQLASGLYILTIQDLSGSKSAKFYKN